MQLHVRLLQEHTAAVAAAAGRRPALLSAVWGQYWLFCEAVWERLSDSHLPPSPTCSTTHWLPPSSFIAAGKAHALQLTTQHSRMSVSTCGVFMCLHKALSFSQIYRCIWYFSTQITHPLLIALGLAATCALTWLAEKNNKCAAFRPTVRYHLTTNVMEGVSLMPSPGRSVILSPTVAWSIYPAGGRHEGLKQSMWSEERKRIVLRLCN